jgi:signal transduction histidine kinase
MQTGEGTPFYAQLESLKVGEGRLRLALIDVSERRKMEKEIAKAKDCLEDKVTERTAELSRSNKQLKYYIAEVIRAQEKERKRIALELHDDTSPSLAYIGLELGGIVRKYQSLPLEITQRLELLVEKIRVTQMEVRRFSHELHPAVLENLGLEAALETLIDEINTNGKIEVRFISTGVAKSFSEETNLQLFRIAQEALNNVQKHSGATRADVELQYAQESVSPTVADNGQGFEVSGKRKASVKGGLGLIGMQERAQLVGADLNIKSIKGSGTTVMVEVALPVA